MNHVSIFEKRWLELVFEGRNKNYGAYRLRLENPRTTVFALFLALLLMATAVVFLYAVAGLTWMSAMLICSALSLVVCGLSAWAAMRYFEHTRLKASRRQLARLGIGELADFTPPPGSAAPAKSVEDTKLQTASGEPVKDSVGVPVTPP